MGPVPMRRSKAITPLESGSSMNSDAEEEGAGDEGKGGTGDNVDVMIEVESSTLLVIPVLTGCCVDDGVGEEQVVEVIPDRFDCPEWRV